MDAMATGTAYVNNRLYSSSCSRRDAPVFHIRERKGTSLSAATGILKQWPTPPYQQGNLHNYPPQEAVHLQFCANSWAARRRTSTTASSRQLRPSSTADAAPWWSSGRVGENLRSTLCHRSS